MDQNYLHQAAAMLPFKFEQVQAALTLLTAGNTVPFIARYRKEQTGNLDEVALRQIANTYEQVEKLARRKQTVLNGIAEQGKLTASLRKQIEAATDLITVEDLYLPYKHKKQTKAQKARAAGLEPLARLLLTKGTARVADFINPTSGILTTTDALAGAHEIMAEAFGENAGLRGWMRRRFQQHGRVVTRKKASGQKNDPQEVYATYYDWELPVEKIAPYQVLAINRAEKAGVIQVKIDPDDSYIYQYLHSRYSSRQPDNQYLQVAYLDGYKRFIKPAIEREIRTTMTEQAVTAAVKVFGNNLYHLLMQAPLKGRTVLGWDPAFRTGCKLAVVDPTGKLLAKTVIYPHELSKGQKPTSQQRAQAARELVAMIQQYQVEMIAIGNGTASRESAQFVATVIQQHALSVKFVIVNEAGASVYSASELARQEFPDLNVEERSAISIARRLQDPLAELIKIDPQAIGVGQYQHDLPTKELSAQVDAIVETSVNQVGVNLNTASAELLTHISGLSKTTAHNIVAYRNEHGNFTNRTQLKQVPRLGPKAFEQAAGFLRVVNGGNILDNTNIHPESYPLVQRLLTELGLKPEQIGTEAIGLALVGVSLSQLAHQLGVGETTLNDIIADLKKPGRDYREQMTAPLLRDDVLHLADLKPGMHLQGTVRNVVDFGAFVDVGVKQDGLVHISQLSTNYVANPREVVAVGDIVDVWVIAVDQKRERLQLSMMAPETGK